MRDRSTAEALSKALGALAVACVQAPLRGVAMAPGGGAHLLDADASPAPVAAVALPAVAGVAEVEEGRTVPAAQLDHHGHGASDPERPGKCVDARRAGRNTRSVGVRTDTGDDGVAALPSPLVRGVRPQRCHRGPANGGPIHCRPSPSDFDGSHLPSTAWQAFWRKDGHLAAEDFSYRESGPHLMLMAFLQRVVNGGGRIDREYALGKGALDLLVTWKTQRIAVEVKLRRHTETEEEIGRAHVCTPVTQ